MWTVQAGSPRSAASRTVAFVDRTSSKLWIDHGAGAGLEDRSFRGFLLDPSTAFAPGFASPGGLPNQPLEKVL
jgi:hypothetical protein